MQKLKDILACLLGLLIYSIAQSQPNITKVEYYIDNDPGYGKATSINGVSGNNISNKVFTINTSTLQTGLHFVGIRALDSKGSWSHENKWIFLKPYVSNTVSPNLTRVEYYIDNDPGYGKATSINGVSGKNLNSKVFTINTSTLQTGLHFVSIRALDSKGSWSHENKWIFLEPFVADTVTPNLTRVEYYIDTDPGYGNANPITITPGINLFNLTANINPNSLSAGVHIFGIRAKDAKGAWSLDNRWLFVKSTAVASSAPNLRQVEYYIDKDPGYGKGVPVAINSSTNLANIDLVVNISGLDTGAHKLFLRSKDTKNSWSLDNVFIFRVDTALAPPSIVVNSIVRRTLCQQDSVNVSYHAKGIFNTGNVFDVELSDASGNFNAPTIIGSYAGTGNSIIKCKIPIDLTAGTEYKIRIKSTNPVVTGLATIDSIKISKLPVPVITPPGTIVILQGDSVKLTTTLGYKSYLWSTSAKTASIQVRKYGVYSVKVTDVNGCSATSDTVLVKVTPVITASGPVLNLCPGESVTLTSSIANNYLWNTADSTKSITVKAAGSYYVVVNGGGKGDTSATVNVTYKSCSKPVSLSSTNITATATTLNWNNGSCAKRYQFHYRLSGTTAWTLISTSDLSTSYNLTGLSPASTYQWQVRTVCTDSPNVVTGYSSIDSFTTSAASISARALPPSTGSSFRAVLYPNPATRKATVQIKGSKTTVKVVVTDIAGKVLWQRDKITNSYINLPVEGLSAGTYLVLIKDAGHQQTMKLVKN